MSYSKIYLGDLPDLIYEIIKYFQNDHSTLHSCILVNRLWCRLAIPLLWENPFSDRPKNYNFIEIYLQYLNDDCKTKLNEYNIINNSLPSNTLFNYPRFLKYLNINKFIKSVEGWSYNTSIEALNTVPGLRKLIYVSLFKIFIENEVNLHILEIDISYIHTSHLDIKLHGVDDILMSILQNTNFIHNIRNFNLYIGHFKEPIKNLILQIIKLHQNFKKILLDYNNFSFYQSLLLSRDYNYSNTLSTIIFYHVDFGAIINLNRIFEKLNVLETIHLFYCSSLNTGFTQQIINLTKPLKLKSLFIVSKLSEIESVRLLIQNSCDYLENLGYDCGYIYNPLFSQLLGLIVNCCKNIKFLKLSMNDKRFFDPAFNLIENIKQTLTHLTIYVYGNSGRSSIVLQKLGQIIPSKLEYLHLYFHDVKKWDFEVFLKNSQDTFIKKLAINNVKGQDILPHLKTYIMKKRRVKYLAIKGAFISPALFEEVVKEFMLYDIKVQSYKSSAINLYDFMKEIN